MFKITIFKKLIVTHIMTLLLAFSITGSILYYSLTSSISDKKVEILVHTGEMLRDFLKEYIKSDRDPALDNYLDFILMTLSSNTGSIIWIVNEQGYIEKSTSIPRQILHNLLFESGYYRLPDERQYEPAFKIDENNHTKNIGDLFGLFKDTGEAYVTIGIPITITDLNGNKKNTAVIYLNEPLPGFYESRESTFKLFLLAIIISVIISIITIYLISRKISNPIINISKTAKIIALGNLNKQLSIKSNDEIGELAKSFNQMVIALRNNDEVRKRFVSNVSHEFRTPMTSIKGFIDAILDEIIPPEKHKNYLQIIRDEIIRLSTLSNQLLDLSRMEAGEMQLSYMNFNINELIRRCIIRFENTLTEKSICIEVYFSEELLIVYADQNSIEQVIINLIHNSIKFTPENGIIRVKTSKLNNKVLVTIQDTGIGIPENELSLIWERFYKSDKSRSENKSGIGLGLSIVKEIINAHNQDIWVESIFGSGTTFYFTINMEKDTKNK
jgi:Signal transduction histidine kinase